MHRFPGPQTVSKQLLKEGPTAKSDVVWGPGGGP